MGKGLGISGYMEGYEGLIKYAFGEAFLPYGYMEKYGHIGVRVGQGDEISDKKVTADKKKVLENFLPGITLRLLKLTSYPLFLARALKISLYYLIDKGLSAGCDASLVARVVKGFFECVFFIPEHFVLRPLAIIGDVLLDIVPSRIVLSILSDLRFVASHFFSPESESSDSSQLQSKDVFWEEGGELVEHDDCDSDPFIVEFT